MKVLTAYGWTISWSQGWRFLAKHSDGRKTVFHRRGVTCVADAVIEAVRWVEQWA